MECTRCPKAGERNGRSGNLAGHETSVVRHQGGGRPRPHRQNESIVTERGRRIKKARGLWTLFGAGGRAAGYYSTFTHLAARP